MSRRPRGDEEEGVELQNAPTVRRNRGRPTAGERAGRRGGSRDNSPITKPGRRNFSPARGGGRGRGKDDSDDDSDSGGEEDDVETPLNPKKKRAVVQGGGGGGSKLWSQNTEALDDARRQRVMALRPLARPLTRKKYIFQQEVMRALILLIFGHAVMSMQILCVYQTQCFDVADDPSNWRRWDDGIVPVCLLVAGGMVPFSLSLVNETNLTKLKIGAGLQFVFAVSLSILGGVAYGEWDSFNGIRGMIKDILNENDYTIPWEEDVNERFPDDAVFFYNLRKTNGVDQDEDVAELANRLVDKMGTLFALNLIGGVLFLALFAFSMSYLCHVYYGPNQARM